MKKIIIINVILFNIFISGCTSKKPEIDNKTNNIIRHEKECFDSFTYKGNIKLVTLEFNGEKHEYVESSIGYGGSLSHWEGCKYCKEKRK